MTAEVERDRLEGGVRRGRHGRGRPERRPAKLVLVRRERERIGADGREGKVEGDVLERRAGVVWDVTPHPVPPLDIREDVPGFVRVFVPGYPRAGDDGRHVPSRPGSAEENETQAHPAKPMKTATIHFVTSSTLISRFRIRPFALPRGRESLSHGCPGPSPGGRASASTRRRRSPVTVRSDSEGLSSGFFE